MTEILNFLIAVHDDRKNWKIKHCLIVLLIFFAHLTAADNGKILKTLESLWVWSSLRRVLKLENGIPSMIRCKACLRP